MTDPLPPPVPQAPAPPSSAVELRVHGVSGTPPQELLDRPLVGRVAGDRVAGFYRPLLRETTFAAPQPLGAATLEGYCWGGLTSGSPSRALWLLLLPFTLVNLAPRMRPVPRQDPAAWPLARFVLALLCRVIALLLTMTLSVGAVGVGVSVLAWQCDTQCPGLPAFLRPVLVDGPVGLRVALGALVPLLALLLLAGLSWRNSVRYDQVRPVAATTSAMRSAQQDRGLDREPTLHDADFWYGRYPVARLRQLHLQAGAGISAFSLVVTSPQSWVRVVGTVLAAVLGIGLLWGLAARQTYDRAQMGPRWYRLGWLPTVALGVVAGISVATLTGTAAPVMPRYDAIVVSLFTASSVLLVALLVVVVAMAVAEGRRRPAPAMWSLGTVVLAVVAVYLGAALASGAVILTAAWARSSAALPGPGAVREVLESAPQLVPQSMALAGIGVLLVTVVVVLVLVGCAVWFVVRLARGGSRVDRADARAAEEAARREAPDRFAELDRAFPALLGHRVMTVARRFWVARRIDGLPGPFAVLVLAVGACGSVVAVAYGVGGWRPDLSARLSVLGVSVSVSDAVAWGAWLTGFLVVGLVLLGAIAFRVPATRRGVGIIWDIASFWPRDSHPLAAPCYAERAVPEIDNRLRWYLDRESGAPDAVVVAAHSQGTVISMAVLLGPSRAYLQRIGFLTCGTVLRRIYARFFPGYFGAREFTSLGTSFGADPGFPTSPEVPVRTRWRNLWRRTDPLGGRLCDPLAPEPDPDPSENRGPHRHVPVPPGVRAAVGSALTGSVARRTSIDVELTDPVFLPQPGDLVPPPVLGHSAYWRDPVFAETVRTLGDLARARSATAPVTMPFTVPSTRG